MTIRPAYPDEFARARALLGSHPVPASARWLVAVKERPAERLLVALAWWETPAEGDSGPCVEFAWGGRGTLEPETLAPLLEALDVAARAHGSERLQTGLTVAEDDPLHPLFLARGYQPCRTFRNFMMPGAEGKARVRRIHALLRDRIPAGWQVERLHDQDPAKVFDLLRGHALMSEGEFRKRWQASGEAGFDPHYSVVLTSGGRIIGLYLLSRRGEEGLHVHAELASPSAMAQSALISVCLRHTANSRCPEGFPTFFSSTAAGRNTQTRNTALRHGGTESLPRHVFEKRLGPRDEEEI